MSATIFVEELDRAGRVERRHRVEAAELRIGRGYANNARLASFVGQRFTQQTHRAFLLYLHPLVVDR